MTDEALRGIAAQCANLCKTEMRNKRSFNALIATYNKSDGLHRMRKIERTIIEMCGEDWLNNGAAKEAAFGVMRMGLSVIPQECIVFATVANDFEPTARFERLPKEEKHRIAKEPGNIWDRVKAGYFEPHDALVVTVQTPQRVCVYKQRMLGASLFVGEPIVGCCDQVNFYGRQKMFGDLRAEDVR
jgi:hypothetical protein